MVRTNVRMNVTKKVKQKTAETINMSPEQVCALFYILVRQNECMGEGNVMSFPLELFKTLPKSPKLLFEKKDGCLVVTIPEDSDGFGKKKESDIFVPENKLILKKDQ